KWFPAGRQTGGWHASSRPPGEGTDRRRGHRRIVPGARLKADGIAVEVFERDYSPTDRLQGYRLGVNETGRRALKECLPKALFEKLIASSANPSRAVTFLDHRLNRLLSIELGPDEQNDLPLSRISLRAILLEGLDEIVRFGKKFIAFEETPSGA